MVPQKVCPYPRGPLIRGSTVDRKAEMQTPYLSSCLCSVVDIQVENHFFKKGEVGMAGIEKGH